MYKNIWARQQQGTRLSKNFVTVYLFEVNFEKNRKTHQQVPDTITDGIAKYHKKFTRTEQKTC